MNAPAKKHLINLANQSNSTIATALMKDFLSRSDENKQDWSYFGKRKTSDGLFVYLYMEADALLDSYTLICHNFGTGSPEALLFQKALSAFELDTETARNDIREHLLSMGFNFSYSHWAHSKFDTIENWEEIERYLGVKFDTNEKPSQIKENKIIYDYVFIDIDRSEKIESFEMETADKNYFVTSFDMFSLKKGINIFQDLRIPINLTKILFSYETSKEDEEYLDYISLGSKINWNEYTIYFQILGEDNKVFEENQRFEKIRFRKLSANYKESLAYVVQDINREESIGKIRKAMKD